jgi:hypothetical protein
MQSPQARMRSICFPVTSFWSYLAFLYFYFSPQCGIVKYPPDLRGNFARKHSLFLIVILASHGVSGAILAICNSCIKLWSSAPCCAAFLPNACMRKR